MNAIIFNLYHNFTYTFISLFSILNPIGMSAVFLAMTQNYSPQQRLKMAIKVGQYGAGLIIGVFYLGSYILNFFGISLASLQIAGGLLVFATAWQMLNAPATQAEQEAINSANEQADITFFPLTMPITAGAGAMAVTVALAASINQNVGRYYVVDYIGATIGIIAVFIVVALCYAFADRIFKRLGTTGTNVVTRLTAFILLAISVSMIWSGVKTLIQTMSS